MFDAKAKAKNQRAQLELKLETQKARADRLAEELKKFKEHQELHSKSLLNDEAKKKALEDSQRFQVIQAHMNALSLQTKSRISKFKTAIVSLRFWISKSWCSKRLAKERSWRNRKSSPQ